MEERKIATKKILEKMKQEETLSSFNDNASDDLVSDDDLDSDTDTDDDTLENGLGGDESFKEGKSRSAKRPGPAGKG